MKKKLFTLSIAQLVFVGLMLLVYFLPIANEVTMFIYSVIYLKSGVEVLSSPLYYGVALHPVLAVLFTIFILFRAIRNMKFAKSESAKKPKRLHTKFLWLLVLFAILYFINLFIAFGMGDGNWTGIIMSAIFCLVPSLGLGVLNKKLKKLNKKMNKEQEEKSKAEKEITENAQA